MQIIQRNPSKLVNDSCLDDTFCEISGAPCVKVMFTSRQHLLALKARKQGGIKLEGFKDPVRVVSWSATSRPPLELEVWFDIADVIESFRSVKPTQAGPAG